MTESEFLQKFENDKPRLRAFAKYLVAEIDRNIYETATYAEVVKVPASFRIKADESILEKVFYRKLYDDPYNMVTDKVGLRYVVLLTSQIRLIEKIILDNSLINASKDRDFEKEKEEHPTLFQYQSLHYVVRPAVPFEHEGQRLTEDLTCEVQIRTILQHAFSEMTHDSIYKAKIRQKAKIHRSVARSVALIEAADEIFQLAHDMISSIEGKVDQILRVLRQRQSTLEFLREDRKMTQTILDTFSDLVDALSFDDFASFLDSNPMISERMREFSARSTLDRQPILLLVYFLAKKRPTQTARLWPYTREPLMRIFSDLGIRFPE